MLQGKNRKTLRLRRFAIIFCIIGVTLAFVGAGSSDVEILLFQVGYFFCIVGVGLFIRVLCLGSHSLDEK
jgi:hypothetical protein